MPVILIAIILSFTTGCVEWSFSEGDRPKKDSLTYEHASNRKNLLSQLEYDLNIDLTDKKYFKGITEIRFNLKELEDITLDFSGGTVESVTINDKKIKKVDYNGFFIPLSKKPLLLGANRVIVEYKHPYSNDGEGLYRYEDVKDNRTYLYTQFEPYRANRMFPCFDQPNLKAIFEMKVLAPKAWEVITSVREIEKLEKGEETQWIFPKSARFSTYTFSLHAGNYRIWEDEAETKNHKIPLRLMARQSLAPFVDPQEWFELTKKGFVFFEDYFGLPYPYVKYDQIIVPDFNFGAMENVGAVTFNEDRFVSKGEKNREQRRRLAITLFHEMAHMWFGNLVTMDWWNDLWLNESFATHSSFVGITKVTDFQESWASFNTVKKRAYLLDQSENTHPIASAQVESTDEAFGSFDAITYRKGASALKQLSFLLGKDYEKGLHSYFSKFAGQNTKLKDFIETMAEVSGRELKVWDERWLKTAMHNKIEVFYQCEKNRITNFEIYQTGTRKFPMLRTHKAKLALLRPYNGVLKVWKVKSLEYSGERTLVKSLIGQVCPSMAYPNYEDFDFVKVVFDKKSFSEIKNNLANIQDPFLRTLIWSDLWMMVVDKEINLDQYLELVEYNGLNEERPDLLTKVWSSVDEVLNFYYPSEGDEWDLQRRVWVKFFEQAAINKIVEHKENEELQRLWFENLIKISESNEVLSLLVQVLKVRRTPMELGFIAPPDLRWEILGVLSANGYPGTNAMIKKELQKDPSKRGLVSSLYAKAAEPKFEVKQKYFRKITQEFDKTSFGKMKAVMAGLFPRGQVELHRNFTEPFFKTINHVAKSAGTTYASKVIEEIAPIFCDEGSNQKFKDYLKAEKGLTFPVVKSIKAALYENEICQGMRKKLKIKNQNQPN